MSLRERIHEGLTEPRSRFARAVSSGLALLIVASVIVLAVEARYPSLASPARFGLWFQIFEYCVLAVFGLEYVVRIGVSPKPIRAVFSAEGLVDLLAILPSAFGLFGVGTLNATSLRSLRLLRFLRVLKGVQQERRARSLWSGTVLAQVAPFMAAGFVLKLAVFMLEQQAWWLRTSNLTELLSVVGFAIGLLLAQKLSVAQERIYAIEEGIDTIIGSLRIIRNTNHDCFETVQRFSTELERFLATGQAREQLMLALDEMMKALGDEDNSWFAEAVAQRTQFVVHRVESRTPEPYDTFLRRVTLVYGSVVVMFMPGLVGLVAVLFVAYVLGGMYVIIDEMDRPIDHERTALIDADYSPLRELNESWRELQDGDDESNDDMATAAE